MDISRHEGDVDSRSTVGTVENGGLQAIIVESSQQGTSRAQINDLGMLICIQKPYLCCIATKDVFLGISCWCTPNINYRLAEIVIHSMEEEAQNKVIISCNYPKSGLGFCFCTQ